MLAGTLPFAGTGAEVALANVTRDPPPVAIRAPFAEVDPLLEAFTRKLMARRLVDRFQSAREALAMLDLIERDRIAAARALTSPDVATPIAGAGTLPANSDSLETSKVTAVLTAELLRPQRRRAWTVLAAVVVAVVVAVGWAASAASEVERSADRERAPAELRLRHLHAGGHVRGHEVLVLADVHDPKLGLEGEGCESALDADAEPQRAATALRVLACIFTGDRCHPE
jgi:hypothetical protein